MAETETYPVECMDCGRECGTSEVSGSTGLCDECLDKRYGPE